MASLEDLRIGAAIRGILSDDLATISAVAWFGSDAVEITFKDSDGRVSNQLLYREDEARL